MKKIISSLFFLGIYFAVNGQLLFQIGSISGNKNDTVTIPVSVVSGFAKLGGMSYSFNYDSNVLAIVDYAKIQDVNNPLFLVYDVEMATHVGSASVKNGQLTFVWTEPGLSGKTIANGTKLFNLRFKLIGKECDSSFVSMTSKPLTIEAYDFNFNNVPFTANSGKIKINGSGCVVIPPKSDSLELIASTETTPQGVVKCIKITTKNFKAIQTAQFAVRWDKTVAKFESLTSGAITLLFGQNYAAFSDSSGVGITWDAGRDPLTLADGTVLFEICLKPVGSSGAMTPINFDGLMGVIEFTDGNGDLVIPKFTPGKLTITGAALHLYYRDTMVSEPGPYCIPIRADNFKCVESFQFGMVFDTNKLKVKGFNLLLPTLGLANINVVKDSIRVTWDATSGAKDLPNGGTIFEVCFESKTTPCPFNTSLRFTDLHSGPIEIFDCNGNEYAVTKSEPNILVKCKSTPQPLVITLGTATAVKCFEDCNGTIINTSHTGGVGPFQYEWKWIEQMVVISTNLSPVEDLCEGTYQLSVIDIGDANKVTTSNTIRVTSPSEIRDSALITHVINGGDGKIDLMVGGGTPTYTFKWRRLSSGLQIAITEDIMNQPANKYEVMITDANGCVKMDTFMINPAPFKIVSIIKIDSSKCANECKASLFVNAGGGVIPYKYRWSNLDSVNPLTKLCKGTYSVTATDNAGATSTASFTVTEPDEIVITIDSIIKSTGSDGKIGITVKGGTPYKRTGRAPYDYAWRNAVGSLFSTAEDLINAPVGGWTICVTDSLLCVKCDTQIIMKKDSGTVDTPIITITLAIDPKNGNRDVSCRGKCDGRIKASVRSTLHKLPFSFKWSHSATLTDSVAINLCPGQSYSVTVTDAAGFKKVSSALIVNDAPPITLSSKKIQCATDKTTFDGQYEAITNGVVEPLTYNWCNGSISKIANDLKAGDCSITVTDANGCSATETFRVCDDDGPSIDCYLGRLAISPNGDGFNDAFVIECALDNDNVLTIYDRWGNIVYSKSNYTNDWNGVNSDNEDLTEGTYLWVLKVKESGKDDAYYKGTVTIVR